MARKVEDKIQAHDIGEFLASYSELPDVFKADQVLNRAFVCTSIDITVFDNGGERATLNVIFDSDGKEAKIETSMKGVKEPALALEAAGYLPFRAKIIQSGKFCKLTKA